MNVPQPTPEHQWLLKHVGEWELEVECDMGPGQAPMKHTGREIVRAVGPFWIVGDMVCHVPGMGETDCVLNLGYDPTRKQFVGSFIASMMAHLWIYQGSLDATNKSLTLDTQGPNFSSPDGALAKFQDIYSLLDDNHRTLVGQMLTPEGKWHPFMKTTYRRVK